MSDNRESSWKGRSDNLKIVSVKKQECDYTVIIELGAVETVMISRPLQCDKSAGTQEHQVIYAIKSKDAISKSIKEHGLILTAELLVKKAISRVSGTKFNRDPKVRYDLINLKTQEQKTLFGNQALADFLGINHSTLLMRFNGHRKKQKHSGKSEEIVMINQDGVKYQIKSTKVEKGD